eukprot:scaffold8708_cov30-Tisochrysis_lutea.AAC.3
MAPMLRRSPGRWRPAHHPSRRTIARANSVLVAMPLPPPSPRRASCQRMRRQSSGLKSAICPPPASAPAVRLTSSSAGGMRLMNDSRERQ